MKPPLVQEQFPSVLIGLSVIIIGLVASAIILLRGVYQAQTPNPSHAETGWQQFEDSNPSITYFKPQCWEIKTKANTAPAHPEYDINYRAGTVHQNLNAGTPGCSSMAAGDFSTYLATLDTTGTAVMFDSFKVGYRKWTYGPNSELVFVDNQQIGQFSAKDSDFNYNYLTQPPWTSPQLDCGQHKIDLKLGSTGNFGLDFIDVHTCTPSATETPTPSASPAPASTNITCQGNTQAPIKCFDCKIDQPDNSQSQINILDFSCFAKFFGQNVNK